MMIGRTLLVVATSFAALATATASAQDGVPPCRGYDFDARSSDGS